MFSIRIKQIEFYLNRNKIPWIFLYWLLENNEIKKTEKKTNFTKTTFFSTLFLIKIKHKKYTKNLGIFLI